jgi:hypothetical protein
VIVDAPGECANSRLNGSIGKLRLLTHKYATVDLITGPDAGREWTFNPRHLSHGPVCAEDLSVRVTFDRETHEPRAETIIERTDRVLRSARRLRARLRRERLEREMALPGYVPPAEERQDAIFVSEPNDLLQVQLNAGRWMTLGKEIISIFKDDVVRFRAMPPRAHEPVAGEVE